MIAIPKGIWPGLLLSVAAAALAYAVHLLIPALPWLTAAILLGVAFANSGLAETRRASLKPGLSFAGRTLMRCGVVLLGLKLSLGMLADLGLATLGAVIAVTVLTFGFTWLLAKRMRLPGDEPLLLAAGFSICGASAIGAMAGARHSPERDQLAPVALVTLCGSLAIALLPLLRLPLGFADPRPFGAFVGLSVHDVGQVVATAQTAGIVALPVAIAVKLARVLLLAPMVTTVSALERRRHHAEGLRDAADDGAPAKNPPLVPWFVAGFMVAMLLRTVSGWDDTAAPLLWADVLQAICLSMALFALGSQIRLKQLLIGSWRATLVAFLSWAMIAALAAVAVHLTQ